MDIAAGEIGISHCFTSRLHRTLYEISGQFIEFRTSQREIQMFRACSIGCNKRQIDIRLRHAGKLDLSLLSSFFKTLSRHLILRQIDAVLPLELCHHPVHNLLVKVIAAKTCITIRSQHLERTAREFEDRYIKCAAAKVKYEDSLIIIFIKAIGKSCSRRLIDDTQNLETGNLASVLGCLTLAVIEVSRNGDDSLADGLAKVSLCICLSRPRSALCVSSRFAPACRPRSVPVPSFTAPPRLCDRLSC